MIPESEKTRNTSSDRSYTLMKMPEEEFEENLFDVINHINIGPGILLYQKMKFRNWLV